MALAARPSQFSPDMRQIATDYSGSESNRCITLESILAETIIGVSPAIRRLRALIVRLAPSMLPVHIHGPTGSGKELVARALHIASRRAGKLVSMNVCAIAEGVFEATLFGHTRGAFTGAIADQDGLLVEADGGTVFLDEIGGMSGVAQAKLLRAIELREFRPVGARKDKTSRFRLLSATNEDLDLLVERGAFREDLSHRLRGAVVTVPPLAARKEDIDPLARHFARTFADKTIDETAIAELVQREWPGNVRELALVVQCASALAGTGRISRASVHEALELRRAPNAFERARDDADARRLLDALRANAWDVDATAAAVGIHRTTVYRRMRKFGLDESAEQLMI